MNEFAALLPDVAQRLLGEPASKTPREWRYGKSLWLRLDVRAGVWRDHKADAHGGTLALIERELNVDRQDAVRWLREQGLIAAPAPPAVPRVSFKPRRPRPDPAKPQPEAGHACDVWRASTPLWDPAAAPAVAYLTGRGLPPPYPETLAYARLRHPETRVTLAALVVARHCPRVGLVRGVQRIFLDPAGGKYCGGTAKMSLGRVDGGRAELLREDAPERLLVAEGVETTLSAARLFGCASAWAMCGGFPRELARLPATVRRVLLVADNDPAGTSETRARALARWVLSTGRACAVEVPLQAGADANDVAAVAGRC